MSFGVNPVATARGTDKGRNLYLLILPRRHRISCRIGARAGCSSTCYLVATALGSDSLLLAAPS